MGRYEVVGLLATGGMAEILLGRLAGPSGFSRPVVIKRILPHLARDRRFRDMLIDEARVVARIAHPNVVAVSELGSEDGELFLVMEYLEGESLGSLMRRLFTRGETLDPALACHVIAETAAGLHAAHELTDAAGRPLELVHRDVTPQNVFVTYGGEIKLLDFGIAKAADRSTRTETGMVKGKFAYMSPEQCLGKPLDRRSDLFSLAILLYELTTGRRLFKCASELLTFRAICELPIVPPSAIVPGYPRELEAIVMAALKRPLDERTPTANAMRAALLELLHKLGEHAPRERLAGLMQSTFDDRMRDKAAMLRAVESGGSPSDLPAAEVDESFDLPAATEFGSTLAATERATPRWRAPLWLGLLGLASIATTTLFATRLYGDARLLDGMPASVAARVHDAKAPQSRAATVRVEVETLPSGANVTVDGKPHGRTPLVLELERGKSHALGLAKAGHQTATRTLDGDQNQKLVIALPPLPAKRRTKTSPTPPSEGFERFD